MCVLANLEYLSILFCAVSWAAAPGLVDVFPIWDSVCVWYCHVPGHWLSSGPWQESCPIWAFVVIIIIIIFYLAHQHKACRQLKIKQEMTAVGD